MNNVKADRTLVAESVLARYPRPAEALRVLKELGVEISIGNLRQIKLRMGAPLVQADASEYIPWELKAEHRHLYPAKQLRTLARRNAGLPVTERASTYLDRWLQKLAEEDVVIHYSEDAGFLRVPRRKAVKWVGAAPEYIDPPWIRDPNVKDDGSKVEWVQG